MNRLNVSSFVEKKIKRGVQLLDGRDFQALDYDNQWIELYGTKKQYLGTAYLSKQNKGIGWLISRYPFELSEEFLVDILFKARQRRSYFEQSELTSAYRLFNQDGDGFGGVTIDRYADYVVFSWYNSFIYGYRDLFIKAFRRVYPEIKGGYEKIRFKGMDYDSFHLFGQESPESFDVLENGVRYRVFMNDGLMTGIFLDQHEVRDKLVNGLASGKNVLNLFSYTAAFSVAAAMGGAVETTSVDLAKRSKELSQAHFLANGLYTGNHAFIVMDVFSYFKYAKKRGLVYDLIIIDPPSFARNKKQTFSVAKDYHRLIAEAIDCLSDNGVIIASTNAANLSIQQFKKELEKGFGGVDHEYIDFQQLPADFTINAADSNSNYLKVYIIRVNK